jgi:hypothetical protein
VIFAAKFFIVEKAAIAAGEDNIQKKAQGNIVPESLIRELSLKEVVLFYFYCFKRERGV